MWHGEHAVIGMLNMTTVRRSSLLAAAAVVALSMLVAACGSGDDDAATTTSGADGGATSDAFPVTIEHQFGTTEVPEEPQRVVSVGFTEQDEVLALGVVPVGIRDWYGEQPFAVWPWATDELGDAEPEVLSAAEIDLEQVAALAPDLIVGISSGMDEQEYAQLSAIAPTIAQSDEFVEYGTPWQDQFRTIATALGRTERAEQLIDELDARFEQQREAHPELEGASAVVAYLGTDGGAFAYGSSDVRARLLAAYGMEVPDEIDELAGDSFYAEISPERLDLLDVDVLIWATDDEAARATVEANPVYRGLDVAKDGRSIFIEDEVLVGAASFSSPLSLPLVLDELTPLITDALEGTDAAS